MLYCSYRTHTNKLHHQVGAIIYIFVMRITKGPGHRKRILSQTFVLGQVKTGRRRSSFLARKELHYIKMTNFVWYCRSSVNSANS